MRDAVLLTMDPGVSVRPFDRGMGEAVAERTVLRRRADGSLETWGDVAHRVALGNASLCPDHNDVAREHALLRRHVSQATLLMSGRHLQHGDETQRSRPFEVFTNCATSATSFALFYLLMNGSGVGRCYDDDMMLVDWDNAPSLRCVLSHEHKDFDWSAHESVRDALHKYGPDSKRVMWYRVPDSREGWAKAVELWEVGAFEKIHKDKMLILDFSDVRPRGSPIRGMQDRPCSGPVSLMNALMKASSLKGSGLAPWKQAMYVDHYLAECVLVGGARRSARMSTKYWRDPGVLDFVRVKRPIEFDGKSGEEIQAARAGTRFDSFLWSSNNSLCVDAEFWRLVELKRSDAEWGTEVARHARRVWKEVTTCSYYDGTGEPGLINVDKLARNDEGWAALAKGQWCGSERYQVEEDTELLLSRLAKRAVKKQYNMITNPCGEIALTVLGGYCVIADVVPFHAETLEEAEEAFRVATRALIRVNTMDSLYNREVARTNRIGVGVTGVHEFAWKFFRVGFRDLIDPDFAGLDELLMDLKGIVALDVEHEIRDVIKDCKAPRINAAAFWRTMKHFSTIVKEEAVAYSKKLGVTPPHTVTTVKPSGSVSKLFGLTEGWHLPSQRFYLRWVQFRSDDPLVKQYADAGYPTRELRTYQGTTIVGFPTAPVVATLGMEDALVTASEATPEEQYEWLRLGEEFWIGAERGNQISYTLKYDPRVVDARSFAETLKRNQKTVRACAVLPVSDDASFEYLPEQSLSKADYEAVAHKIAGVLAEDVDKVHLDCASGACPVDFAKAAV